MMSLTSSKNRPSVERLHATPGVPPETIDMIYQALRGMDEGRYFNEPDLLLAAKGRRSDVRKIISFAEQNGIIQEVGWRCGSCGQLNLTGSNDCEFCPDGVRDDGEDEYEITGSITSSNREKKEQRQQHELYDQIYQGRILSRLKQASQEGDQILLSFMDLSGFKDLDKKDKGLSFEVRKTLIGKIEKMAYEQLFSQIRGGFIKSEGDAAFVFALSSEPLVKMNIDLIRWFSDWPAKVEAEKVAGRELYLKTYMAQSTIKDAWRISETAIELDGESYIFIASAEKVAQKAIKKEIGNRSYIAAREQEILPEGRFVRVAIPHYLRCEGLYVLDPI